MFNNRIRHARRSDRASNSKDRGLRFEPLEDRLVLAAVPLGFTDSVVHSGGSGVTVLQFDDTGRGWVGFDNGRIGIIENDVMITTNAYDLNAETMIDLGLLGMELDKDFLTNGYIYVGYAADDAEPNAKFSRIQVDLSTGNTIIPNSETVLLELPNFADLGDPTSHIVGAIHHADDGTLFLQVGDFQLRAPAQDLSSPLGKVLRINTDGTPATDNPYYDVSDGLDWIDYVWASGVRNPFAGDIDPVTGRYFVSDVGSDNWEEINDATQPGLNFGWPAEEGPSGNLSFTDPHYAYSHAEGCAITGGTFYNGTAPQFPVEYEGLYFFSEFCAGEIRTVDPDDPTNVQTFASGITSPLNIAFSPDGSMYYIAYNARTINKVQYTLDAPPQIALQPVDALATVGGDATFSVSVGGASPFTYQWQQDDGNGFVDLPGATNAQLVLDSVPLAVNGNRYRVVVTNSFGTDTSAPATLNVTTDTPPVPEITLASTSGNTYRGGDTITFSGIANDAQDGTLPPEAFSWTIDFHHNVHTHPVIETLEDVSGGQFVVPTAGETDPDVWFRVYLTATDSAGFQTTAFAEIFPEISDFTVEATGPLDTLLVDSQTEANPAAKTGVEGVLRSVSVPDIFGTSHFVQWLDGDTDSDRIIATPTDDTTYVALYGASSAEIETVYLSDMTPVGTPINGWGPIELDMSVGGQAQGDGGALLLNGVSYPKGLGVHADSEVVYDLSSQYDSFSADIGLNGGPRETGEVVFEVYGDDMLLYSSGIMTGNSATQSVELNVEGVQQLKMVVDGNGSIDHDSANWADAKVTRVLPSFEYLSDLVPVGIPINGWGPIEIDMSVGGQSQGDGGTLLLNGVPYEKGLGVHADSEVIYALDGNYARFISDIGLNGGPRETGEVIFEVYGDNVLLYSSDVMTGNSATQTVDVDVTGMDELRLVVDGNGSIDHDSANWADAQIVRASTGNVEGVRGVTVNNDGLLLRMLPYLSADATLDTELEMADIFALTAGWGSRSTSDSFQQWIRAGDFNLDGFTNQFDWEILNAAWLATYGLSLGRQEFFSEQEVGLGSPDLIAQPEIVFDLSVEVYQSFMANLGPISSGTVDFQVIGDGAVLFSSGPLTAVSPPLSLDVDVTGIQELRLVAAGLETVTGETPSWMDAKLVELVPQQILLGDFDGDNVVSGTDFLAWQRNHGIPSPLATRADGDADFDGDVDRDDLELWQSNYGSSFASSTQTIAIQATNLLSPVLVFEPAEEAAESLASDGRSPATQSQPSFSLQPSKVFLDSALIQQLFFIEHHESRLLSASGSLGVEIADENSGIVTEPGEWTVGQSDGIPLVAVDRSFVDEGQPGGLVSSERDFIEAEPLSGAVEDFDTAFDHLYGQ